MKRVLAVALVLVLALGLAGCIGEDHPVVGTIHYEKDGQSVHETMNFDQIQLCLEVLSGQKLLKEAPEGKFSEAVCFVIDDTTFAMEESGAQWVKLLEDDLYFDLSDAEIFVLENVFQQHGILLPGAIPFETIGE